VSWLPQLDLRQIRTFANLSTGALAQVSVCVCLCVFVCVCVRVRVRVRVRAFFSLCVCGERQRESKSKAPCPTRPLLTFPTHAPTVPTPPRPLCAQEGGCFHPLYVGGFQPGPYQTPRCACVPPAHCDEVRAPCPQPLAISR